MIWPTTQSAAATTSRRQPMAAVTRRPRGTTSAALSESRRRSTAGPAQGSRGVRSVAVMGWVYPFRAPSVEQNRAQVEPAQHAVGGLRVDARLAACGQHLGAGGGERLGLHGCHDFTVAAHGFGAFAVLRRRRVAAQQAAEAVHPLPQARAD